LTLLSFAQPRAKNLPTCPLGVEFGHFVASSLAGPDTEHSM
jgi:hypothetical protein